MALQPDERVVVEAVERLIEDEQIRPTRERPDQHDLAGLAGREFAERPAHQGPETQRVDQAPSQIEVLAAVLDDLGNRCAFGDHVEDVGVVFSAFGGDQLGLPLIGHERDPLGDSLDAPRQDVSVAGQHRGERRLAGAVGAGDQPVLARTECPVDVEELKALVEVDRQRVQMDHARTIRRCASCRPCGPGAPSRSPRPGGSGWLR